MASPKKIIARTKVGSNQYQICLFRRKKNHKLSFVEILVEDAPSSSSVANVRMNNLSQQLKIPWHKKLLNIDTTKRLLIRERRKARKEAQNEARLAARSIKSPLLTFDGSSLERPGRSASAAVIEMPDYTRHTATLFMPSAHATEAEYTGLIIGLEKAIELGISKLEIKGDSQTIIYQVSGKYQLEPNSRFVYYRERVLNLLSYFDDYSLSWIPRRKNQLADRAADKCLKENCPLEDKSQSYAAQYFNIF
jgi:ribonuclease HI